jgi:hypothetical protein
MTRKIKKSIRFEQSNLSAVQLLANNLFSGDFSEALNYVVTQYRLNSGTHKLLEENSALFKEHMLFEALKKEIEKKKTG